MLVSDLLYAAYRIAGIIREAGRGYTTSRKNDALNTLNAMLDAWKAERLMVYAVLRDPFNTVANQGAYTIGQSGSPDWSLERPEKIHNAGVLYADTAPTLEVPLEVLTLQQWQAVGQKAMTSTRPTKLYYEPTLPNGTVRLWPIPTETPQIVLYTWRTVNTFTADTDPVVIAPAYQEAIEYNLAIRLAARFPERQMLSPVSVEIARNALAKVKAMNMPESVMRCEAGALGVHQGGRFNMFTNRTT